MAGFPCRLCSCDADECNKWFSDLVFSRSVCSEAQGEEMPWAVCVLLLLFQLFHTYDASSQAI